MHRPFHPPRTPASPHDVPNDFDWRVAELKLDAEGIEIDGMSDAQVEYWNDWQQGT